MVAVADTEDGIAAVCNLAKRPRSIYLLYYLPQKNCGCRPKGGGFGARAPPLNTLLSTIDRGINPQTCRRTCRLLVAKSNDRLLSFWRFVGIRQVAPLN
jgi:hypothetical protein